MQHDPNSNQNPELNRGRPDYENPSAYETPNTPYEGAPNPYETTNTPYGGTPNSYGAPNTPYGTPETPYATGAPPRRPLPLGEAIRELPNQYIRTITRPGTGVFAEEQGKAAWNIVWVQLIALAIITALLSLGTINIALSTNPAAQQSLQAIRASLGIFAILALIFTPIAFFIGAGIYHLLAKAFGGRGTFLPYCYCYLLFGVPLGVIGGVLGLIPFVGSLLTFAVSIYQIVLQVYMTMAVHRLTGGKATLAVLILPIIIIVLAIILTIVLIGAIAAATHPR